MLIYFITRGFPDAKEPTWGSFEFDQAKALVNLGHKVVYLCVDRRFRLFVRKIGFSKQIIEGITIYNSYILPNVLVRKLGENILYKFRTWQLNMLYKKAVKENGSPDILYSHYLFVTQEAVALKQKYNIPLVAIEHWSELKKEPLTNRVIRYSKAYQFVDQLIVVSKALKKTIQEKFNVDSTVVYNMVGEEFQYKHAQPSSIVRFVTAGSLIPRKGFDILINAFAKTQLSKKDWQLNIIGAGSDKEKLQAMIEQAGLKNNIILIGQKNKKQIEDIYQKSDVFVLASRSETFGVVYIEAMACGLPVIATPCGGPEEFVNKKNGLLVPIDDVDSLAKALEQMFAHYQEYDRQAIADDCKAHFSSEIIAKQLTGIFEQVIANTNR